MRLIVWLAFVAFATTVSAAGQAGDKKEHAVCTLKVSGMVCSACSAKVEKTAKKLDGVIAATASQPKGVAEITYDPTKTTPEAIAKIVTEKSGFKATVQKR